MSNLDKANEQYKRSSYKALKSSSDVYKRKTTNGNGVKRASKKHAENMADLAEKTENRHKAKAAASNAYNVYIGTPLSYLTHPVVAVEKRLNKGRQSVERTLGTR